MSALELKPCPFCGTSLEDESHPGSTVEGGGFTFECGKCGANWPLMTREAMDGLDDEGIASFFNSRSDLPPGYVILSPDEVRGMERDRQAVEFAARWCWRTDPPNAHNKLTDAERLSVIKHHPTIKQYGQPHIDLAGKEAVEAEARENYQRHVEEVNRATDAEIDAAIRSLKGGRDAQ